MKINEYLKTISMFFKSGKYEEAADSLGEFYFGILSNDVGLNEAQTSELEIISANIFDETFNNQNVDFLPLIIGDIMEYKDGILVEGIVSKIKKADALKKLLLS